MNFCVHNLLAIVGFTKNYAHVSTLPHIHTFSITENVIL